MQHTPTSCRGNRCHPVTRLHGLQRRRKCAPVARAAPSQKAVTIQANGMESRSVGCLLGTICGDVLGTPMNGLQGYRVAQYFPSGLTNFFPFGVGHTPGAYSGISRSMLALGCSVVAEGRVNPDVAVQQYIAMFDGRRQYLAYERLVFSALTLRRVFQHLKKAIIMELEGQEQDTSRLDHKVFVFWWREYVDMFCPDIVGNAATAEADSPFDYLGIVEEIEPDDMYRRYKERTATRTMASDPLGLLRFDALYNADEAWVQDTTRQFAQYAVRHYGANYGDMIHARNFVRDDLKATPADIPTIAGMWKRFAEFARLPAAQSVMPTWWFTPLTSMVADPATQNTAIVESLLDTPYQDLPTALAAQLDMYDYKYTTMSRMPGGTDDCGGAARVAALALAYRSAPAAELREVLAAALSCSHRGPAGLDGALVHAEALRWLCRQQEGGSGGGPQELLTHLESVAETEEMREKLRLLASALFEMPSVSSWRETFASRDWHNVVKVFQWVVSKGFPIRATDAVAAALWALCINWGKPEQAVITAAHLGGWSGVTASMTGAMAGALHGHEWIPARWLKELENGPYGRDYAVKLARELAALDCSAQRQS